MKEVSFENGALPVFSGDECISKKEIHSEMAHYHDDLELIVVNNGTIMCQTAGTEFQLYTGDVCFINRRQLHQIHTDDGDSCNHKVLIIGTSLFMQNTLIYEKYIRPILEDMQFTHVRFEGTSSPAAEISGIVTEINKLQKEKPSCYELDVIALIHRLGKQLYLAYTDESKPGQYDGNAVTQQKMAEFIYANYGESLTLDDIAASGNVSRSQCAKLFKQYTGLSPINFLNGHRLERALGRLRGTTDSVAVIASECGFSDQSYFNRLFMRHYGVTPLAYRKSA